MSLLFYFSPAYSMEENIPRLAISGEFTIGDILGTAYSSYKLNAIEHKIFNKIIIPLLAHQYNKISEVLRGAYVIVDDQGATYEAIARLPGAYLRESSHYSEAPEFSIKLPTLGAILTGIKNSQSWFQLEASPQFSWLAKNPSEAFTSYWSKKMLRKNSEQELKYDNEGVFNPVTFFDWLKHDFWDYPRYLLSGKRSNIGPFGSSRHTESYHPIEIKMVDEENRNNDT